MNRRFNSCGLSTVVPNEGKLHEFSLDDIRRLEDEMDGKRLIQASDPVRIAVAEVLWRGLDDELLKYGLFHFRPDAGFTEEDGSAKYDIFHLPVRMLGAFQYVYFVLDRVLGRPADEGKVAIAFCRLRGVSNPIPIATPEYDWCNADGNWDWWSREPATFNVGAVTA